MIADEGQVQLADGRTTSYTRYGAREGPTVVVLDGAGSRAQAHGAASVAARLGIRLLAPDRPGFRGSTPDPELTPQRSADAIAGLLDRLAIERVGVLAQSLGAPFALALAHGHPDRVNGLGLVCPIGPLDVEGACEGMDRPTRMLLLLARRAPLVLDGIFRSIRWQVDRDPERSAERFTRLRPEHDQLVMRRPDVWPLIVDHFPEMWASPTAARREFTAVSRRWGFDLEGIEVPTTIWATETDTVHPPAMARDLAKRIPGATLVLEAEGGVFSFLDRTEEILHTVAPDARPTVEDRGI